MVKLATARELRLYGPWLSRNKLEYINAGIYVFASILLLAGFVSQLSPMDAKSGLVVLLIALMLFTLVNFHDLFAHFAGIDYRLSVVGFDAQLALVEFAVPIVHALGSILTFVAILLIFIQEEKGFGYYRWEKHSLSMLVAGPALWLIGSIHNLCQIYERADGHVQILQVSTQIPFLMGSLLFMVGSILNLHDRTGKIHHGLMLLGKNWVWMGILGCLLFLLGGLVNLVKVFKMQQPGGMRLEKLRGGGQERLIQEREGLVPLILEEHRKKKKQSDEEQQPIIVPTPTPTPTPTPYKDVLVSGGK
ncbi:uncharacterized protein LOC122643305 [Telopea speciosissima]|uniref:uncharacterized protein LOC122643305 n=1 Tax=Telopea speciosissima TaxID=54955 RepID=UPI001CC5AFF4|nr:uncharacterized protein LOC122643305 [Telopea speciosissima]